MGGLVKSFVGGIESAVGGASEFVSNIFKNPLVPALTAFAAPGLAGLEGLAPEAIDATVASAAADAGVTAGISGGALIGTGGELLSASEAATPGAISAGGAAVAGADIIGTLKTAATILSPVSSLLSAASGVRQAQSLRTVGVEPPPVPAPTQVPVFGGAPIQRAETNAFVEQVRRRGRASTILTSPTGERLGS